MNFFTKARLASGLAWSAVKSVFTTRTLHLSDWFRGLSASWTNPVYANLAKKAHRNPYAGRGLRLISQAMASIPLLVEQGEKVLEAHDVLLLLKKPNPRQSYRHFIDALVNHLYLGGELFIERRSAETGPNRGRAKRLYLWRPDRFQAFLTLGEPSTRISVAEAAPEAVIARLTPETRRLSSDGDVIGYRLTDERGQSHLFTIDEMLHVRIYNPTDEDRGLPLILACARAIEQMEAADDWNKNLSANAGRVPGYFAPEGLQPGQQLGPEQVSSAEANLDQRVKERRRNNLPMVLSGAFKYIGGAITPKDADWLESDKNNARKVATVLGVPARLLGDEKQSSLTDAGIESEMKALLLLTVLPQLDFLLEELSPWLLPAWGQNLKLTYDKDQIEALQEDMTQKYRRYREACGVPFLAPNQALEALGWDKQKDKAFDQVYVPLGVQPMGGVGGQNDRPLPEPAPLRSLKSLSEDDFNNLIKRIAA